MPVRFSGGCRLNPHNPSEATPHTNVYIPTYVCLSLKYISATDARLRQEIERFSGIHGAGRCGKEFFAAALKDRSSGRHEVDRSMNDTFIQTSGIQTSTPAVFVLDPTTGDAVSLTTGADRKSPRLNSSH